MFDFTGLDPETIANFWIYCIGFLIIGLIGGWFFRVLLTKASFENFRSDKEKFEAERVSLIKIKKEYEDLCKKVEKSDEYWLYIKQTSESHNDNPSKLLHEGIKKN